MIKTMLVFGTRPEAVKMCPVVEELQKHKEVETIVCVTGQHREMLIPILDVFGIVPQYDLDIMRARQTLFDITEAVLTKIKKVLEAEKPDVVLVHGDTTSAFAAALACYYMKIPVCHVEAGLRTYDHYSPYPEEFNRQAVDSIAEVFFAPTEETAQNLIREGRRREDIYVTGNTVIDALKRTVRADYTHEILQWTADSRFILLTAHRRENTGSVMREMFSAVRETVEKFPDVKVVYPVHLNPTVRKAAQEELGGNERIRLIEPMDVMDFHNVMSRCYMVATDSGGIQEEAPALDIPVLVMRDTTERPEGVAAGTLRLVGTKKEGICSAMSELLTNEEAYSRMAAAKNPYGDGKASMRIALTLLDRWKK